MKKIGIITLNGYFNYGNRLQNYALQEVLKELGFEVETIIKTKKQKDSSNKRTVGKLKQKNLKELYKVAYRKALNSLYKSKLNEQRTQIFKDFSYTYIRETDFCISDNNIPEDLFQRYDYFVTGSDQVWNPTYKHNSSIEFLTFVPPEKRIAYAPSFGVSEIPEKDRENYTAWLSELAHISVREEAGAKIIKELTGREAPVLVDPTMLLTKEKWLSIAKAPDSKPKNDYLLTYFLGEIPRDRRKRLNDIAKKNDLKIVNLAQIKDRKAYLSGPSEFIDYINNSSLFCTDSFHGAVFSVLLDTPFIVFNREDDSPSMNSRIDTLLKKFKLESRSANFELSNTQIFDVDYSHTIPILEKERAKSLNYLKNALSISNN